MSYRSALGNPSTSSGNVGQVASGDNYYPPGGLPLTSGVPAVVDTVTISAGVWNINTAYLALPNSSANTTSLIETITNSDGDVLASRLTMPASSASSVSQTYLSIQNEEAWKGFQGLTSKMKQEAIEAIENESTQSQREEEKAAQEGLLIRSNKKESSIFI